jgi:hypothetical protein
MKRFIPGFLVSSKLKSAEKRKEKSALFAVLLTEIY